MYDHQEMTLGTFADIPRTLRIDMAIGWIRKQLSFDMTTWVDGSPSPDEPTLCNTPACIAGTIALRIAADPELTRLAPPRVTRLDGAGDREHIYFAAWAEDVAGRWLDLPPDDASSLFTGEFSPTPLWALGPDEAIFALETLRDEGAPRWPG